MPGGERVRITELELEKVHALKLKIKRIESYLDAGINSPYVRKAFAICDTYENNGKWEGHKLDYNNDIHYFIRDHKDFMNMLNDFGFKLLEEELEGLKKEYRKIVKVDK